MSVLSLLEMPKLKELAAAYGYNIHVHDACGGQSFTLEPAGAASEEVYSAITAFFAERQMTVNFYDAKKLHFVGAVIYRLGVSFFCLAAAVCSPCNFLLQ